MGLEYSFLKVGSCTAHIWEQGGATCGVSPLLSIPMSALRAPSSCLLLILDVSQPQLLCMAAERLLADVRQHLASMWPEEEKGAKKKKGMLAADTAGRLCDAARARMTAGYVARQGTTGGQEAGAEHPDLKHVAGPGYKGTWRPSSDATLLPIPVVIAANKFDTLADRDGVQRRAVLSALCYIALCHGAHLVCTSAASKPGQPSGMPELHELLSHCTLSSDSVPAVRMPEDGSLPFVVRAGGVSLDHLALPPGCRKSDFTGGDFKSRLDKYAAWINNVCTPTASSEVGTLTTAALAAAHRTFPSAASGSTSADKLVHVLQEHPALEQEGSIDELRTARLRDIAATAAAKAR